MPEAIKHVFLLFAFTLLLMPFAFSSTLVDYKEDERLSVYSLEKINVFEPIPVIIEIHDRDYLYALEEVWLSRCLLPLGPFFGLEDFPYEGISLTSQTPTGVSFQWPEGERKIEFEVSMSFRGVMPYTKSIHNEGFLCSITLVHNMDKLREKRNVGENVLIDMRGSTALYFDFYDFDFGIEDLPSGYVKTRNHLFPNHDSIHERFDSFTSGSHQINLKKEYEKEFEDFSSKIILDIVDGTEFTYQEFLDGKAATEKTFRLFNNELDSNVQMDFNLGTGQFAKRCSGSDRYSERSTNNNYRINCFYYATIFSFAGPIIIGSNYRDIIFYGQGEQERAKALDEVERKKSKFENQFIDFANNIYFQSDGKNLEFEFEIEEREEEEEKEIADKKFEISFRYSDSEEIWNRGRVRGDDADHFVILARIEGKAFDEDGKEIKVSSNELFQGARLIAKIQGNESQIGIGSRQTMELNRTIDRDQQTVEIWGKGPRRYEGYYQSEERIDFYVEYQGKKASNEITYKVNIKDASPRVILQNPLIEVQDGERRVISFNIEDDDQSELECSIMIPSRFSKESVPRSYLIHDNEETTLVTLDCKDGDNVQVIFHAPNLGNFDLNNELSALSMWKYQQDTMKTLAEDLIGLGVDKRLEFLKEKQSLLEAAGSLDQAQQYADALNTLDRVNKLSEKVNNVVDYVNMPSDIIDSTKDHLQSATDIGERTATGQQGWIEWGADWGVYGIDLAQTTVGVISKAPERIPVLGPLGKRVGSGFSTSFNLMTNVWKGNFQYLANVERINRAEEMYFPYPVMITVYDEDGFVTKEVQNVMVVYNWLN